MGGALPPGFTLARIQRELSATEAINLQCSQLKRQMANKDLCTTVTVKAVDSLIARAQSRIAPALMPVYTSSLDPCAAGDTSGDAGVVCLERCRGAINDMQALKPLVEALQAKPTSKESSGAHLMKVCRQAKEQAAGFNSPPNIYETALKRDGLTAFQEKDLSAYYTMIKLKWIGDDAIPEHDRVFVGGFPDESARPQLQDYMLVKLFADICNMPNSDEGLEMVKGFLKVVVGPLSTTCCYVIDNGLKKEFDDLEQTMDPMDYTHKLDVINSARNRLMANRSGRLYKAVNLYPTGQALLEWSLTMIGQRGKDERFNMALEEAVAALSKVAVGEEFEKNISIVSGKLTYPSVSELLQIRDVHLDVTTNSSQDYRQKIRSKELAQIEETLKRSQAAVLAHHQDAITKSADKALAVYTQKLTRVRAEVVPSPQLLGISKKAVKDALAQWQLSLATDPDIFMKDLAFPDQMPSIRKKQEAWKNATNTLLSSSDDVITGNLDATSTTAAALHDIIGGTGPEDVFAQSTEFTKFSPGLKTSLLVQIGRALGKQLSRVLNLKPVCSLIQETFSQGEDMSALFDVEKMFKLLEPLVAEELKTVAKQCLTFASEFPAFRLDLVHCLDENLPLGFACVIPRLACQLLQYKAAHSANQGRSADFHADDAAVVLEKIQEVKKRWRAPTRSPFVGLTSAMISTRARPGSLGRSSSRPLSRS